VAFFQLFFFETLMMFGDYLLQPWNANSPQLLTVIKQCGTMEGCRGGKMMDTGTVRTTAFKLQRDLPRAGWLAAAKHLNINPDGDYLKAGFIGIPMPLLKEWEAMGTKGKNHER